MTEIDLRQIGELITQAKLLARQYRHLTGRPLGITGEVAEYEAARLLTLRLSPVRQAGYDAIDETTDPNRRVQIIGRCVLTKTYLQQRLGRIDLDQEWDEVVLVLLDQDFEPLAIYRAPRPTVEAALRAPGSRARNERGALSIGKFKAIAQLVWNRTED
jgi:hypothetical protein